MSPERISSLHDDLLVPKATEHLGEYSTYPERFDPKEKSVLTRLEQFGVDVGVAKEVFGKEISDFSWEDYSQLVGEAVRARYDVIVGSVFDQYMFPTKEDKPDDLVKWQKMMLLVERYKGMQESVGLSLVKRKADFTESGNLVLGLEAGAHLITSMEALRRLEDAGVKVFGFQYNTETPLASKEGLKPFGNEVARYLFDHNLIIDLAHSGFQTRQDVMELAEVQGKGALVSYTHGSSEEDLAGVYKDRIGERALKKEEIERLIRMGGIIGLGVTQPFFANTRKLAERINEIAQLHNGINGVAIGTDFGGIMPEMLNEIHNPDDFKVLADFLSVDFGMSDIDVNKVLRSNAREWIQKAID